MTGWDVLDRFMNGFPPIAAAVLLITAAVIFIIGFSRRGMNFIKYGFGQTMLDDSLGKRFDSLDARIDGLDTRIDSLDTRIDGLHKEIDGLRIELTTIKVNHFGHLKNYLGVLNGILLDKGVIDNESRARLDNELRGM